MFKTSQGDFTAEIIPDKNEQVAQELTRHLPIRSTVNTWGEEIYFSIPVEGELEDGIEVLEVGDIAFWPPGNAFCIFFGPTPVSTDKRPRAAGPVTVIGNILNKKDITILKLASDGQAINLT